jgi:hypothetical protein
MRNLALVMVVFMATALVAQDPASDAKAVRAKEHHDALVAKAKQLLEQKESLEKALVAVNAKLDKLTAGEDVELDGTIPNVANTIFYYPTTSSSGACCTCVTFTSSTIMYSPCH